MLGFRWRFTAFCSAFVALGSLAQAAVLHVTGVSPSNGAVGIGTTTPIVLTFDLPLNLATVTSATVKVMGKYSGPVPGAFSLDAGGTHLTFTPGRPYFVAEEITLMASSAVRSTGLDALVGGFYASWYVKSGVGSKTFALTNTINFRQPGEGLIRLYGFSAIDVDGDGSADMSATNELSADVRLRKNDGCGNVSGNVIFPMPSGQEPSPNEAADLDGDGDPDLVTGNQSGSTVAVFKNTGGAWGVPVVYAVGGSCHGVAVLDADSDGDIDVMAANLTDIRWMKNDGTGVLSNGGGFDGGGIGEWQVVTTDANDDGHADMFVGNEASGTIGILLGDGAGHFPVSATRAIGSDVWGVGAGDVDGDGNIDAIGTDNLSAAVVVVRGNGAGGFLAGVTPYSVGTNPVSVDLADFDGDGDLDLSVANFGSANASVFFNSAGTFVPAPDLNAQSAGSCTVPVDFDRDGDTDLVVTDELADKAFVYLQTGPTPTSVQPPSCSAALRVDNFAMRAGFGSQATHAIQLGAITFVNVSGGANRPYLILLGSGVAPGAPTGGGLFNLSLAAPLITLISGFPAGVTTNALGEATLPATIPFTAPIGIPITLQGAVGTATPFGAALTNPETIVLQP